MASSARRIENNSGIWSDEVEGLLGFGEMGGDIGIIWGSEGRRSVEKRGTGEIGAKFLISEFIAFDESEGFVASDRKTNSTNTSVEIEDFSGGNVFLNGLKSEFINRKIDLEKAIRRIRIGMAENGIGEGWKMRVRLVIFVKTARNLASLVGAEE